MIENLFNDGATPVLERLVNFTAKRQRVLANDIANLSTPGFKPADLDPIAFQKSLREAIDRSDRGDGPIAGPGDDGADASGGSGGSGGGGQTPTSNDNQGILFHDQNNRDLERIMQHLAENTLAHSTGIEMLRDQFAGLKQAISERV